MSRTYSASEMEACLPAIELVHHRAAARTFTDYEAQGLDEVQRALAAIPPRVPGTLTYPMYRNVLWGLIRACEEAGAGIDTAIALMAAHSPQWKGIEQVARSGGAEITAGSFWFWTMQHGYRRLQRHRSCRRRPVARRPAAYVVAERRRKVHG